MHRLLPLFLLLLSLFGCADDTRDASHFYQQASAQYAQGRYDEAVVLLKNALRADPDKPEYWVLCADAEEKRGNLEEAFFCLSKALELAPEDPALLVRVGQYQASGGNLEAAVDIVGRLQKLAPEDPDARLLAALLDLKLGDYEAAARKAAALRKTHDLGDRTVFIEASALIALKRHDEAEKLLAEAVKRAPANLALATLRFENLQRAGRIDAAVREIDRIHAALGNRPELLLTKAELLERHGRIAAAEKVYRQLAKGNADPRYGLQLARFLFRNGQAENALHLLENGLATDTPDPQWLRFYAYVATASGRQSEARQQLQKRLAADPESPALDPVRLVLAGLLLDAGDTKPARALVRRILNNTPTHYAALILDGEIDRREKRYDNAVATLRKAIHIRPDQPDAWLALGKVHESAGNPLLAREAYQNAWKLARGNPAVAYEVARFHFRQGNHARADEVLARIHPDAAVPPRHALLKAAVKLKLRQWDAAGAILAKIEEQHPGIAVEEVELLKGELFRQQQRWEESIATYQRLVSHFPGEQRPLAALIRSYVDAGRFDDAENFLRSVIAVYPDNIYARLLLAQRLIQKPDHPAAEKLLRETLRRKPEEPMTWLLLARLLRQNGRTEEAARLLDRWMKTQPWNAGIVFERARLEEAAGRPEKAMALYRNILARDPDHLLAANNLASLLLEGSPDNAAITEAVNVSAPLGKTVNPYFLDTHGWARFRAGKPAAARDAVARAARLLPDEPVFEWHLAEILLAQGLPGEALRAVERAEKLARERNDRPLVATLAKLKKRIEAAAASDGV